MGNLIPIFAITVGLIITVTAILSDTISKYKLKVEQIRADAMVRAEEVRSRNQLELERLMRQDQETASGIRGHEKKSESYYEEDSSKQMSRIRE